MIFPGRAREGVSYETGALSPVSSMIFPGRAREVGCFRDRAARPAGRTTPPTDPDERNERIRFLEVVVSLHAGVNNASWK